jgi:hypothetical protein
MKQIALHNLFLSYLIQSAAALYTRTRTIAADPLQAHQVVLLTSFERLARFCQNPLDKGKFIITLIPLLDCISGLLCWKILRRYDDILSGSPFENMLLKYARYQRVPKYHPATIDVQPFDVFRGSCPYLEP